MRTEMRMTLSKSELNPALLIAVQQVIRTICNGKHHCGREWVNAYRIISPLLWSLTQGHNVRISLQLLPTRSCDQFASLHKLLI